MERNCLQGCSSLSALPRTNQFKVSVVPQKRAAGRRGPEGLQWCSQVPSLPQLVQVMCGYRVLVGVCGHLDKAGDLASSRITSGGTAGRWDMLAHRALQGTQPWGIQEQSTPLVSILLPTNTEQSTQPIPPFQYEGAPIAQPDLPETRIRGAQGRWIFPSLRRKGLKPVTSGVQPAPSSVWRQAQQLVHRPCCGWLSQWRLAGPSYTDQILNSQQCIRFKKCLQLWCTLLGKSVISSENNMTGREIQYNLASPVSQKSKDDNRTEDDSDCLLYSCPSHQVQK